MEFPIRGPTLGYGGTSCLPGSVDVSLVWGLKANDAMPLLGKAAVAWHFQVPASTTTGVSLKDGSCAGSRFFVA